MEYERLGDFISHLVDLFTFSFLLLRRFYILYRTFTNRVNTIYFCFVFLKKKKKKKKNNISEHVWLVQKLSKKISCFIIKDIKLPLFFLTPLGFFFFLH
jgi:hypothetical protein